MKQGHYNSWGLYHDPADPRLIVPKRVPAMGWTINIGHRYGRASLFAVGVAIVVTVGLALVR